MTAWGQRSVLPTATGAAAATVPSCEAAAVRAEKAAGIPSFLLAAISRTETGHTRAGRGYGAWPWTLNIRGKGYYFETREDALAALQQAIDAGANIVMLDNFSVEQTQQAVELANGRVKLEASGNMDGDKFKAYAALNVDYISIGGLTKHVQAIDLSMRFDA